MGGGRAIVVAALDPQVTLISSTVPALAGGIIKVLTPYPDQEHNAGNAIGMRRIDEILRQEVE